MIPLIKGSCHCKNITFEFDWNSDVDTIAARACSCTFCFKHGGVWTSSVTGKLNVNVKDRELLKLYNFGTKTADFYVCKECGIVPLSCCTIDGNLYAVVNINTFEGIDPTLITEIPVTLTEETESSRLARRKKNWINNVQINLN
ncbi:hypothetical protein PPL_02935 [Heterostelium album PN500]|uniref:CENP-V/GFA domain-containing protein n=1 Tax=Heterostelium pallidum (strain ATCC 26659 / Pp 5 / PN500) TaxID=670386 RepID=D3B3G7_HETP5|nr:hypothetical protein PPL_02935 [Heterostelium album PN500]EFA83865.1 hypothetical protein PPL_02935 [Heterostelium album PN500]|eukprot:XP_020435982.1 hypothetical protein PPL_02935 [Heterostelium album PN500]